MAFTLKDMENQKAEFEALQEEFSRLNLKQKQIMSESGLKDEDINIDINSLTGEEKAYAEAAIRECQINSSKAQTKAATESRVSHRRNAIRA